VAGLGSRLVGAGGRLKAVGTFAGAASAAGKPNAAGTTLPVAAGCAAAGADVGRRAALLADAQLQRAWAGTRSEYRLPPETHSPEQQRKALRS